jgi:Tol biopolymer transport system component
MCIRHTVPIALVAAGLWSFATAMSGKAVTSIGCFDPSGAWTSRLIVVTVANSVVTGTDTIVPAGAMGTQIGCPRISPDGKRIAFSRSGVGLSVVDIDGKNLRTLGDGGGFVSWSGLDNGKRIYYYRKSSFA